MGLKGVSNSGKHKCPIVILAFANRASMFNLNEQVPYEL